MDGLNNNVAEETTHDIYRSPVKLAVMSIIIIAFGAVLGSIAIGQYVQRTRIPLDHTFYWILGLAAFAMLLFAVRVLPMWLALRHPAITISSAGIQFRNKPLLLWYEIKQNDWNSLHVGFLTAGATLIVKAPHISVKCEALTLACKSDQYFEFCERAKAQQRPVPTKVQR